MHNARCTTAARDGCRVAVIPGATQSDVQTRVNAVLSGSGISVGTVTAVGYTDATHGFDSNTCSVISSIHAQSPDIAMGVDTGGAGDQGLMFGYATNESPELMPLPILLAHKLTKKLADARRAGVPNFLRPDGKSQVSVEYDGDKPVRIDTVVISTQHAPEASNAQIREEILEHIIKPTLPQALLDSKTKYHINPTGRFVVGGPQGDCGLTGRRDVGVGIDSRPER